MSRSTSSQLIAAILFLFLVLALPGCAVFESVGSFSDSSGSLSDSTDSASDSSGSSSDSSESSSDEETAYQEDVRAFTAAHVRAGGTPVELRLGLSEVALGRGISDWEASPSTFVAVGSGLAEAGIDRQEFMRFGIAFAPADSENRDALDFGFDIGSDRLTR